ncbi:hypothetical protein DL96DRAFT_1688271 [Flagelloscypha sp. PMI_526]|nr:hypothetical protein DL96DRAFT_1688271 [Flagelloscypha sp. PMI_526]
MLEVLHAARKDTKAKRATTLIFTDGTPRLKKLEPSSKALKLVLAVRLYVDISNSATANELLDYELFGKLVCFRRTCTIGQVQEQEFMRIS